MESAKRTPTKDPSSSSKSTQEKSANTPYDLASVSEWYVYQKAVAVHDGIRSRSNLVRSMEDKVLGSLGVVFKAAAAHTDIGKAADDISDVGVQQVNAVSMISDPISRIQASIKRVRSRMVQCATRYFPPFVLARWSVDIALAMACLTLAFMRDLFRIVDEKKKDFIFTDGTTGYIYDPDEDPSFIFCKTKEVVRDADGAPERQIDVVRLESTSPAAAKPVAEPRVTSPDAAKPIATPRTNSPAAAMENENQNESAPGENSRCENVDELTDEGNVREPDNRNLAEKWKGLMRDRHAIGFVVDSALEGVQVFTNFVLAITIPAVMFSVCMLRMLSKKVHKLFGEFDSETPEDCKMRQDMLIRLIGHLPQYQELEPLRANQWVVDIVLDRYAASLMKWTIVSPFIPLFVSRPVTVFENMTAGILNMVRARHDMVDYMKDDPDYDEDEDPDYQPNESDVIEDSLEYKDDAELEPDGDLQQTTTNNDLGKDSPRNQSSPAKASYSLKKKAPPSENNVGTGNTISPATLPGTENTSPNMIFSKGARRKSGVQANSTPKDNVGKNGIQGTSVEEMRELTTNLLALEEEKDLVILAPLSPENLKRIKTRGPVQAAVIRIKGDMITDFEGNMKGKKQDKKRKTEGQIVQNPQRGCKVKENCDRDLSREKLWDKNQMKIDGSSAQHDEGDGKGDIKIVKSEGKQSAQGCANGVEVKPSESDVNLECLDTKSIEKMEIAATNDNSFEGAKLDKSAEERNTAISKLQDLPSNTSPSQNIRVVLQEQDNTWRHYSPETVKNDCRQIASNSPDGTELQNFLQSSKTCDGDSFKIIEKPSNGTQSRSASNASSEEIVGVIPENIKASIATKTPNIAGERKNRRDTPKVSPQITTATKRSLVIKNCLEIEDGMGSSSVDSGQASGGW